MLKQSMDITRVEKSLGMPLTERLVGCGFAFVTVLDAKTYQSEEMFIQNISGDTIYTRERKCQFSRSYVSELLSSSDIIANQLVLDMLLEWSLG